MTVNSQNRNNIPKFLQTLFDAQHEAGVKVATYIEKETVDRITKQDKTWAPLAYETIRRKNSPKAWIDTSSLYNEISYKVVSENHVTDAQVGVWDSDNGYIARCLEYGTTKKGITAIPARPLFRPVYDENLDKTVKIFAGEMYKHVKKHQF